MNDVTKKAFGGLIFLIVALGILLFLPAWTLNYPQAWIFLVVFSVSVFAITLYLAKNDPKLLERRIKAGSAAEKEKSQKVIQFVAQIAFILVIVLPPLDHRFIWSVVPVAVCIAGNILVVVGLFIVFLVFKENTFTSAIIEVATKQKVIVTGPYAIVRHPMYSGALIMLAGIPLALGSLWGLLTLIPLTFVIVMRLLAEEIFLAKQLPGYREYQEKVIYRLLPFIW